MTRSARLQPHPSSAPVPGAGACPPRRIASTAASPGPTSEDPVPRRERDARLSTLLAAAAAGDAHAFEGFYEGTFAFARTVARRLLRDNAEIEDLLADCYFEAWRSAARFDPARGSPVSWLLTLVRSRGLDALRAAAARPERAGSGRSAKTPDGETASPADDAAELPDNAEAAADPAERLWRRQAGTQLHAALARLSPAERWVIGLAYLRELSHAEIARCTGLPLGTVKSHALRAQNKLRTLLAPGASGAGGATGSLKTAS